MLLCSISYSKVHGDCSGIPVGLMFADRKDLYDSGLHGRTVAGIFGTKADGGAFSIVLNEGYEDDEDQGETIIYTGEGKGKPDEGQDTKSWKKQQADQDMNSPGNAALKRSVETGNLVRVIRGSDGNIKYAPLQGYRYDGLYKVERAYIEEGKAGFKMCKFLLRRDDTIQPPLPTHITGKGVSDKYWAPGGQPETLAVPNLNKRAPETANTPQTIAQKRQEITGKKRLPTGLGFKKKTE
ncbi:PUA-like domain-containing protein [Mycena albidolilacea]|uniref:PUA-like domain-containing protein n=1 Tax=Mycena albidolilacea TaxID=1033008 RepID=A0AAD6ZRS2_9AGAR|nr:PUA-like domain-containing protein [Mycena albidolilacea]